jgi:hypothetical protein
MYLQKVTMQTGKNLFFVDIFKVTDKKNRIRISNQEYRSKDPDPGPSQNVTDPLDKTYVCWNIH